MVRVCREWGIRPSEFGICTADEDMGVMMQFLSVENRMTAFDRYLSKRDAERKRAVSALKNSRKRR